MFGIISLSIERSIFSVRPSLGDWCSVILLDHFSVERNVLYNIVIGNKGILNSLVGDVRVQVQLIHWL